MFSHLQSFATHRTARSIGFIFALQGVLFGTWAALIPVVKHRFDLDEAQLGLLLLCLQGGVLVMNPFSVPVLHRLGAPLASIVSLSVAALFFALTMFAPSIGVLGLVLFGAGAGFASANVAMNTAATLLESREPIRIMSTCHALWSSGAMLGSALASTATGAGIWPAGWSAGISVLVVLSVFRLQNPLKSRTNEAPRPHSSEQGRRFAWPSAGLWVIIFISLCTNITEGTMADWGAVFMRDVVQSADYAVGWGFAAYAFFMAAGRFMGDALLARFGAAFLLRLGGLVAASGLFLLAFLPVMPLALFGFALIGAGVSLGAPILYAAAARAPGMAQGVGLATMNTFAMVGFFGGPVLIGFLGKIWSLPLAFGVVGAAAVAWAWQARKV